MVQADGHSAGDIFAIYDEENPGLMKQVSTVLMISDVITWFLTGEMKSEITQAATSQLIDMDRMDWDAEYERIGAGRRMVSPRIAVRRDDWRDEAGNCREKGGVKVVAVAGHDTASAASCAASCEREKSLYLSCGTWSCMGCVTDGIKRDMRLFRAGVTNDLGLNGEKQLRFNHTGTVDFAGMQAVLGTGRQHNSLGGAEP